MTAKDCSMLIEEIGASVSLTIAAVLQVKTVDFYFEDCVPDSMGRNEFVATISDGQTRWRYLRDLAKTSQKESLLLEKIRKAELRSEF